MGVLRDMALADMVKMVGVLGFVDIGAVQVEGGRLETGADGVNALAQSGARVALCVLLLPGQDGFDGTHGFWRKKDEMDWEEGLGDGLRSAGVRTEDRVGVGCDAGQFDGAHGTAPRATLRCLLKAATTSIFTALYDCPPPTVVDSHAGTAAEREEGSKAENEDSVGMMRERGMGGTGDLASSQGLVIGRDVGQLESF